MYDKKKIYKEKINDIIMQLRKDCIEYGIPMFATFAIKDDGKKTDYASVSVAPVFINKFLSDDKIIKHTKVDLGFDEMVEELRTFDLEDIQKY